MLNSVLSNLSCLANYGVSTGFLVIVGIPILILGILMDKADRKAYREGRKRTVKPSKNLFDWMFYNYDK